MHFSSDMLGGCGLSFELLFIHPCATPLHLQVPGGHPWGQSCIGPAFGLCRRTVVTVVTWFPNQTISKVYQSMSNVQIFLCLMKFKNRGEIKIRCNRIKLLFLYAPVSMVLTEACSMSPACSPDHCHNRLFLAPSQPEMKGWSSVSTLQMKRRFSLWFPENMVNGYPRLCLCENTCLQEEQQRLL